MPTLNFLLYLLAILLAGLFRLSYLGWFGPYLLACVIIIPLFLLVISLPSMLSMGLSMGVPKYIVRGSKATLQLFFETKRFIPVSKARITIRTENRFAGEIHTTRHTLYCVGKGCFEIPLDSSLCGVLSCQAVRVEYHDLLGLFSLVRKNQAGAKCTVIPLPVPPDSPLDLDAALNSTPRLRPKYGGGFSEEHDLRDYQPGDSMNSIHWKLSSKVDDVIVREALDRENNEIFLVLSRIGKNDRGLEILYWLSLELCRRELPHVIVGNRLYPVGNEEESREALSGILNTPMGEPCSFDAALARCTFLIAAEEVRIA